jgi:secreted trypsin-like serine protease
MAAHLYLLLLTVIVFNNVQSQSNRFLQRVFPEEHQQILAQKALAKQDLSLQKMGYNMRGCGACRVAINQNNRKKRSLVANETLVEKKLDNLDGERPRPTIINGSPAVEGQFPWQVSLQLDNKHVCGAAVMSKCHVITAAHCISGADGHITAEARRFKVVYGSINNKKGKTKKIAKLFKHAYFSKIQYDVALLQVEGCFTFDENTVPVCMPEPDIIAPFQPDDVAVVSGWGVINEPTDATSNYLQYLNLRLIPSDQCAQELDSKYFDAQSMICQEKSNTGCCFGDSGGPLVWYHPDNYAVLIGKVSWLLGHCGDGVNPSTIFTDTRYYLDWAKRAMSVCPCTC